jgi:TfoX/Sxy family transcriptional regulator of competence genes
MVTENTLYLRVDDDNRAVFKDAEADPPLSYRKRGSTIDLSFWRVPERLFNSSPGRAPPRRRQSGSLRSDDGR